MPFGIKNLEATYQRIMDQLLKGQKESNMKVYVEELLVKRNSPKQSIKDLKETFATLTKYNMQLNPLKCTFGARLSNLLGFLITHNNIKVNTKKVKDILTCFY